MERQASDPNIMPDMRGRFTRTVEWVVSALRAGTAVELCQSNHAHRGAVVRLDEALDEPPVYPIIDDRPPRLEQIVD